MAKNAGQVKNLKPFVKGDPRIRKGLPKGSTRFAYDNLIKRALQFKTPVALQRSIKAETGQDVITYEQAILATLVANAAQGSTKHMDILFKLNGAYARAEAEAKKEVERDENNGETGSTLLIKVVRRSDVPAAQTEPRAPEIDVTPEENTDAT